MSCRTIDGDMLDITSGILIHQQNCQKKMGAGIALQIRNKFPTHYSDYMRADMVLGTLVTTRINNKLGVIGMLAQYEYGSDKKQTNYSAFEKCLYKIKALHEMNKSVEYYMPYLIGCALAGGDWNTVSKMVYEICPFITFIKYNK